MYFSNLIGLLSQLGTFMIIFSTLYFLFKFIIDKAIVFKTDYIVFKRVYISDCLSIILSLLIIIKFINIYPIK